MRNDITKQIRLNKKIYYNEYFSKNNQNIRKLWIGINELINAKPNSKSVPTCIETKVNGKLTTLTEPKDIADTYNNHYTTVADKILEGRKYPGNKLYTDYLKDPNQHTFMTKPTTPKEIEDIIMVSNTMKSTGPYSIPNQIIKQISTSISTPISNICNNSFITGKYPDVLKISKVIPIHKKDSKLDVSNYRPISLLSNINKIIEKLMFERLYTFLEMHNCIYELQFGFRQKHSTNHALLSMTQEIRESIDKGSLAIGVFVDFQKAFDTVNHEILLRKMSHYGVRGVTNNWFQSYLTNRKQFVTIDGFNSDLKCIKHGVPQGSVLGPLLFLIYINDLHTCIRYSTTRHFADDTNLLYRIKKKSRNRNIGKNLNIDLKSLNHWLLANKISLNSTKTEIIFFRAKWEDILKTNITLNGIKLVNSVEIKYVGIVFDEHLSFEPHRKILNAKLKRANNLLAISRHYVPKDLLIQIYYGQFYSHLCYGCQLWGQNANQLSQTLVLQKKAMRLISFAHFQAHTDPLFKDMKMLKIMDIVKMNNILFVHNVLNNKAPKHFNDYFVIKQTHHDHRTINNPNSTYSIPKGSLVLPQIETAIGKQQIKYICSENWNSILKLLSIKYPQNYLSIENWMQNMNITQLKKRIKYHFLELYGTT